MEREKATIAQILHSLEVGGAEIVAARIARGLRDHYRFVFVCLDERGTLGKQLEQEGFRVLVVGRQSGVDWRCVWKVGCILRDERVKLIHGHQYTPTIYGLLARLVYGIPSVVFHEHGRHHPDYPRWKRRVGNRLLFQTRDSIVAVGNAVKRALIANEGLPEKRIRVIYNGIDLWRFGREGLVSKKDPGRQRLELRRELGLGLDDLAVIMVARLDYLKDHLTALRVVEDVGRHRPCVKLLLVGEGPMRCAIEEHVNRENLTGVVRLLGLRSDVAELLTAADIFLLTSISEGIPLTVIEAMAAGLPVVATQVGGVPELVVDGETGYMGAAGDHPALAGFILKLAESRSLCVQLGATGRRRAEAMFTEKVMLARFDKLYQGMLSA